MSDDKWMTDRQMAEQHRFAAEYYLEHFPRVATPHATLALYYQNEADRAPLSYHRYNDRGERVIADDLVNEKTKENQNGP